MHVLPIVALDRSSHANGAGTSPWAGEQEADVDLVKIFCGIQYAK
jgi:hypothetical protein